MPGAEPYSAEGDRLGVLMLHGFAGTPAVVRPWAQHLAAAGHTVTAPRLPGHGTRWQDLNATTWRDWFDEADRCLDQLRESTDTRVVMGLGTGATIGLRLAEVRTDVDGIVAVNPVVHSERRDRALLPYLQRFVGSVPWRSDDVKRPGVTDVGYDRLPLRAMHSLTRLWTLVKSDVHRITAPLLVFRSADDHVVEPSNTTWLLANVRSHVDEVLLEDSYHLACVDNDAPMIFEASARFARSLGAVA